MLTQQLRKSRYTKSQLVQYRGEFEVSSQKNMTNKDIDETSQKLPLIKFKDYQSEIQKTKANIAQSYKQIKIYEEKIWAAQAEISSKQLEMDAIQDKIVKLNKQRNIMTSKYNKLQGKQYLQIQKNIKLDIDNVSQKIQRAEGQKQRLKKMIQIMKQGQHFLYNCLRKLQENYKIDVAYLQKIRILKSK